VYQNSPNLSPSFVEDGRAAAQERERERERERREREREVY
jgi:hypothetical protein